MADVEVPSALLVGLDRKTTINKIDHSLVSDSLEIMEVIMRVTDAAERRIIIDRLKAKYPRPA